MKPKALLTAFMVVAATTVALATSTSPASADLTYEVKVTNDELDADPQLNLPDLSLREAVFLANTSANDITFIDLAPNVTYELTICGTDENANNSGDLDLTDPELVYFGLASNTTVRQTCPGERVLDSTNAAATLDVSRVTITGGSTASNGGGIRTAGDLDISLGAIIEGNSAGGAGGGVWSGGGSVDMAQSTVRNNTATGSGGGIRGSFSVRIYRSTLNGNVAGGLGGAFNAGSNARIETTTVTQNRSAVGGGGGNASGYIVVDTATVLANRAPDGANLRAVGDIDVVASVLALGSGGPDCNAIGTYDSGGYNVGHDSSCGPNTTGDLGYVHPMLAALPADDFEFTVVRRPVAPSPALDHDPSPCVGQPDDQLFDARPAVAATPCESGSVERAAATCSPSFSDVAADHAFYEDICWLDQMDITGGFDDGTFKPGAPVTRQSMSAFIFRLAGSPPFPDPVAAPFSDVGVDHPFATEIAWMADADIAEGYDDGTFRSSQPVSRQAMAAFLYRVAGEPSYGPLPPAFTDVGTSHPFFTAIGWLAFSEVAGGYDDDTFRPSNPVSRQAMAAFLLRLADDVPIHGL